MGSYQIDRAWPAKTSNMAASSLAGYLARHSDPEVVRHQELAGKDRPMWELLDATWAQMNWPQIAASQVESERQVLEKTILRLIHKRSGGVA